MAHDLKFLSVVSMWLHYSWLHAAKRQDMNHMYIITSNTFIDLVLGP